MTNSDTERQEPVADPDTDTQHRLGPELHECPVCGAVGLPERIADHDCQAFLDRQESHD